MGFDASLVESLVQTKYLLTGQHYTSVSDLVTDVLQAEEEERHTGPQGRGSSELRVVERSVEIQIRWLLCVCMRHVVQGVASGQSRLL